MSSQQARAWALAADTSTRFQATSWCWPPLLSALPWGHCHLQGASHLWHPPARLQCVAYHTRLVCERSGVTKPPSFCFSTLAPACGPVAHTPVQCSAKRVISPGTIAGETGEGRNDSQNYTLQLFSIKLSGTDESLPALVLACSTATATWDPNGIYDLYHSSRQRWILNPLSEARDPTRSLMDTSQVPYH